MDFEHLRLAAPAPVLVRPSRHQDARGYLAETFQAERFGDAIGMPAIAQENLVFSEFRNTVRGLHAQAPPHAQAKLVGVMVGRILDVAVDIRRGSPTYGQHIAVELTAAGGEMLYVPAGYLHGYVTLEDRVLVSYKLDALYAPGAEFAVRFDDPDLNIDWRAPPSECVLSDKDRVAPTFAELESPFAWQGEGVRT